MRHDTKKILAVCKQCEAMIENFDVHLECASTAILRACLDDIRNNIENRLSEQYDEQPTRAAARQIKATTDYVDKMYAKHMMAIECLEVTRNA